MLNWSTPSASSSRSFSTCRRPVAEHAEAVDDLVRDELRVGVARAAVMRVVVALARADVVRERLRDLAVLAVAADEVGDVVADHAAEPAALLARVVEVVAEVGGRRDADRDLVRVAPGRLGRRTHALDRPPQDHRVGELEDEAVRLAARPARAPSGRSPPSTRRACRRAPTGSRTSPAGVSIARPSASSLITCIASSVCGQRRRLLAEHAPRGVAPPDAADRAVAEHVVERREQRRGDRRVARRRVGHERADHDPLRRRQHLRVDDVGLLPQDVGVERPRVREAEPLRRRVSSTTRLAGGSVWNVTPKSMGGSLRGRGGRWLRARRRESQRHVGHGGDPEGDEHAVAVELVEEVRVGDHAALRRRRVQEARAARGSRPPPPRRARASCSRARTSTRRPARRGRARRRRAARGAAASSRRPSPRGTRRAGCRSRRAR